LLKEGLIPFLRLSAIFIKVADLLRIADIVLILLLPMDCC